MASCMHLQRVVVLLSPVLSSFVPSVSIAPGVDMPMLALGAATSSFTTCSVQDGVEQWLRLGGRHIDTAHNYGTQPDVGRAVKAAGLPRQDVFITTKIPGPIGRQNAIDLIEKTALPQLGLDYIDLVLIHFPCTSKKDFPNKCGDKNREERLATWDGLRQLQKEGKIRAAGVSNYNADQIAEIINIGDRPAVNQVEWHLGYHNETLLTSMKRWGVTLEAWASLAGPTATMAGHSGISLRDPRLKQVADKYNASTAQLALRWSAHKGVVPVTGSCEKDHVLSDLNTFAFDLEDTDVTVLDQLRPHMSFPVVV